MHINITNAWADFWRCQVGVNVIPADAVKKKTWIKWTDHPDVNMQEEPIPQMMHDTWKKNGDFKNGMAIICGKIFHRPDKKHLWLAAVDLDNMMAIEKIHSKGIKYLASKTLVEQHANTNKAHVYFYTTRPMHKKSSDATNAELLEKMNNNEIPALELKGEGKHGIMYCTPSPHEDGSNYEIVGVKEPAILDEIGDVVNKICEEYSLGKDNNNLVPMKVLMDNETKILEGHNRHEGLMRWGERMLRKYPKMEKQMFKDLMMLKNMRLCDPPLSEVEVDKQIKSAVDFISVQVEKEVLLREYERHKFGTDEFWRDVMLYKQAFKPEGKFIKCLECDKKIDADPLQQNHYGHKVDIK